MRNLKRALSLLLSSTLVLGMLVMGGSAAGYKDVDASNDHQEAIEVLQAVGIMTGDQNGNFNPDGSITRNEMAVIMAHLLNLDYDYYRGTNPFTDVPEWAAPYVAACAAEGVVAGIGNGQYGGDNKVTAAEASLMIMKALGYFQNAEDFGTDWQVATIRQASYIDLFNNINANAESALTRAQVAQLVLNGLKSDMVDFTGDKGIQIGDVTVGYRAEYTVRTSSDNKYNSLVGGTTDIGAKDKYTIQLGEELYNGKLTEKADTDAFDRPATTWRYDYNVIGTYVNDPDLTYTAEVEAGEIYADLGLSKSKTTDGYYVDGKEQGDITLAKNNDDDTFGANGVLTQVWYDEDEDSSTLIITEINTYVAEINNVVKADDEADRYVTLKDLSRPGTLNNKFETQKFAKEDLVTYTAAYNENTSRYDIQAVDSLELTTTGVLTEWKGSAIYVPGEKGTSNSNFTVDNETYKYSKNNYIADENGASIAISDFEVNESEVNIYLDEYGYAIYVSGVEAPKNYAAVIGVGESNQYGSETKGVTLLLTDGTQKEVIAKMDSWSELTYKNYSGVNKNLVKDGYADLVTYTVGDDGIYKLSPIYNDYNGTDVGSPNGFKTGRYQVAAKSAYTTFENGKSLMTINTKYADTTGTLYDTAAQGTYYTTSETVFMVATYKNGVDDTDGYDYNVYVGYANAPGIDTAATNVNGMAFVMDSYYKNQIDVVYIDAVKMAGVSGVDTYFVKDGSSIITDSNGKYYVFPAIVDGAETTIKIDAETVADWNGDRTIAAGEDLVGAAKGLYAITNVTKDSKGIITGCTQVNGGVSNVFDMRNIEGTVAANEVVLGIGKLNTTAQYWAYNDKTNVYYVSSDFKSITVSDIKSIVTDYNDRVYAIYDSANKVLTDVVVVEVPDTVTVTYGVAPSTGVEFYNGSAWVTSLADQAKGATVYVRATDPAMKPVINGITLTFAHYDGATAVYTFSMPAYNIAAGAFTTTSAGYAIDNVTLAKTASGQITATVTANAALTGATVTYEYTLLKSAYGTGPWMVAKPAQSNNVFTGLDTTSDTHGYKVKVTAKIGTSVVATFESDGYALNLA